MVLSSSCFTGWDSVRIPSYRRILSSLRDGLDKEQWEPTIQKLFTLQSEKSNFPQIREAWALDWQSHGESAVLNELALKDDPESARTSRHYSSRIWLLLIGIPLTALDLWGYAIAEFLKSDLIAGHRLVGVGYSSGTVGL
jgi:hypothetical protein